MASESSRTLFTCNLSNNINAFHDSRRDQYVVPSMFGFMPLITECIGMANLVVHTVVVQQVGKQEEDI